MNCTLAPFLQWQRNRGPASFYPTIFGLTSLFTMETCVYIYTFFFICSNFHLSRPKWTTFIIRASLKEKSLLALICSFAFRDQVISQNGQSGMLFLRLRFKLNSDFTSSLCGAAIPAIPKRIAAPGPVPGSRGTEAISGLWALQDLRV